MARARVLLVHDDADCRSIFGTVLDVQGYDVVDIRDGDEAMRLLATGGFDLVVTDLYVRSAVDECLVRRMQRFRESDGPPVIVLTTWASDAHRELAVSLGADAFLTLPFPPLDLVRVAGAVLDASWTAAAHN